MMEPKQPRQMLLANRAASLHGRQRKIHDCRCQRVMSPALTETLQARTGPYEF